MEIEKNIEDIELGIVIPSFLDVFIDSFQQSGLKSLRDFINEIDCKKWNIYSDYAFKEKENDVATFSIVPYIFDFARFKEVMNELAPKDLKNTRSIDKKFLDFLRHMPILHISIVLSKKRKIEFSDEKKFLLYKTRAVIAQLNHWCQKTPKHKDIYTKQIKNFKALEANLNKNAPNLSVIRDIEIIATLVSYIICEMSRTKELDIIGWSSDRDRVLSYMNKTTENSIIFDLISLYTFALFDRYKIKEPQLGFGVPEKTGLMWYDEFNRLPDYISGTIADYNIQNNTVSKDKFIDMIEDVIASNINILYYKLDLVKTGIASSRVLIKQI